MIDFVIVTHLPSFYKVNLYNQLSQHYRVHVIFLGRGSKIRTDDFVSNQFNFEATFLSEGSFENKPLNTLLKLKKCLKQLNYKKLIVGGWEHLDFWLAVYLSPKSKNCLCLESGYESKLKGPRAWLKKLFLSRISCVLAAGQPQSHLARRLNFKQVVLTSQGVGLFHHTKQQKFTRSFKGKFLYVGRLASEKNIERLLRAFSHRPQFELTLAGQGDIQVKATENVHPLGHVPHAELERLYHTHDVLILPSLHEPWGLVVEEALYHGMPVLLSDRVGAKEIVEQYHCGLSFNPSDVETIVHAMDLIAEPSVYAQCIQALQSELIEQRQMHQVKVFSQVL